MTKLLAAAQRMVDDQRGRGSSNIELWEVYALRVTAYAVSQPGR